MIIDKNPNHQFQISLTYSAAVSMIASLHVMANPQHHPVTSAFVMRKYRSLPDDLREEIDYFARHYSEWSFISDVMMELAGKWYTERLSFQESIRLMNEMPDEEFAYIFLGLSAFDYDIETLRKWMADPDSMTDEELGIQKLFLTVEDAVACVRDVPAMKARVTRVLERYWDESFSTEWTDIEAYFESVLHDEEVKLQSVEFLDYLKGLHPDLMIDAKEIVFHKDPDFSIAMEKVRRIIIALTVFNAPHLNGNIVRDTVFIMRNLNFHAVKLNEPIPPQVSGIMYAACDDTRMRIIKMLWNSDATTKEMADVLLLSPSTISTHLKVLKDADLVDTTKVKKFVYYQLKKQNLRALQANLIQYLDY